jgi:hypothetical protein
LSNEQLANRPLSATAKRFLSMIVERRETTAFTYNGSFPIATYDGWYLDLYPHIDTALEHAAFMADYATFDRDGEQGIHYLGAKAPRLGVFVVDTGGAPRVMVGPVAHAFQHTGPLETRLTDEDADDVAGLDPWAKSYTVPAVPEPEISIQYHRPTPPLKARFGPRRRASSSTIPDNTTVIDAPAALGEVTVELLDHHFVKMKAITVTVDKGTTNVKSPVTPRPIEALRIRVGAFSSRIELSRDGEGNASFGGGTPSRPGVNAPLDDDL